VTNFLLGRRAAGAQRPQLRRLLGHLRELPDGGPRPPRFRGRGRSSATPPPRPLLAVQGPPEGGAGLLPRRVAGVARAATERGCVNLMSDLIAPGSWWTASPRTATPSPQQRQNRRRPQGPSPAHIQGASSAAHVVCRRVVPVRNAGHAHQAGRLRRHSSGRDEAAPRGQKLSGRRPSTSTGMNLKRWLLFCGHLEGARGPSSAAPLGRGFADGHPGRARRAQRGSGSWGSGTSEAMCLADPHGRGGQGAGCR